MLGIRSVNLVISISMCHYLTVHISRLLFDTSGKLSRPRAPHHTQINTTVLNMYITAYVTLRLSSSRCRSCIYNNLNLCTIDDNMCT